MDGGQIDVKIELWRRGGRDKRSRKRRKKEE